MKFMDIKKNLEEFFKNKKCFLQNAFGLLNKKF